MPLPIDSQPSPRTPYALFKCYHMYQIYGEAKILPLGSRISSQIQNITIGYKQFLKLPPTKIGPDC